MQIDDGSWTASERGPVATGLPELDAMLAGGLAAGSLTLLCGDSRTGKSALARAIALGAAGDPDCRVGFSSTEACFRDLVSALARAAGREMPQGTGPGEAGRWALSELGIVPSPVPPLEVRDVENGISKLGSGRDYVTAVYVLDGMDGIKLPAGSGFADALRQLKCEAMKSGVAVVATTSRPPVSDEAAAAASMPGGRKGLPAVPDVVIDLQPIRGDGEAREGCQASGLVWAHVLKNRVGALGKRRIEIDPARVVAREVRS